MDDITESELLEELRRALGPLATDAFTSVELGDALGVGDSVIRRRLRPLLRSGRVVAAYKSIQTQHGKAMRVPAYRIAA